MFDAALTEYIDVAQVTLYVFWAFFAGLIFYLRREDKREGYPLVSDRTDRTDRVEVRGFPSPPAPKTFILPHGHGTVSVPRPDADRRELKMEAVAPWPGAPFEPTGNPMLDGVGPASWAQRSEHPDLTLEGREKIVPMRVATDVVVEPRDPDPRGMEVIAADGKVAGKIVDIWVDRSEHYIRYLEVDVAGAGKRVLLPMTFVRVHVGRNQVRVASIYAEQFANVPALGNPDHITQREEDRITGYYAGGHLYASPRRLEPIL